MSVPQKLSLLISIIAVLIWNEKIISNSWLYLGSLKMKKKWWNIQYIHAQEKYFFGGKYGPRW
jgi:hypothetical protein